MPVCALEKLTHTQYGTQDDLLYFTLYPLPLVLSLGTAEKSWALPCLLMLNQVFLDVNKILLSLLFSRLYTVRSLSLS